MIQLTGKVNYTRYATSHGMTLEQAVEQLSTPQGAVESAAWFWDSNKLNAIVDRGDFVLLTKRINGGTIGLEDRRHHYEAALSALGA